MFECIETAGIEIEATRHDNEEKEKKKESFEDGGS